MAGSTRSSGRRETDWRQQRLISQPVVGRECRRQTRRDGAWQKCPVYRCLIKGGVSGNEADWDPVKTSTLSREWRELTGLSDQRRQL